MAHPSYIDRSFAQLARRAIARCSYDISPSMQAAFNARARLKDAQAKLGPHPGSTRAKDRRYAIHVRARTAAALVATAAGIIASEREVA